MKKFLILTYISGNFNLLKNMVLISGFLGMLWVFLATLQNIGVYQVIGDGTLRASITMSVLGFLIGYLCVKVYDELVLVERSLKVIEVKEGLIDRNMSS